MSLPRSAVQVPRGGLRVLPAARVGAYVLPANGSHDRVLAGSHQTLPARLLHLCADWSLWREGEAAFMLLLQPHFFTDQSHFGWFYLFTNPETLTCDLLPRRTLADVIVRVALLP